MARRVGTLQRRICRMTVQARSNRRAFPAAQMTRWPHRRALSPGPIQGAAPVS
jgi:hypothetical protein